MLQQLGWLYHHNPSFGNQDTAISYLMRSIDSDPSDGQTWYPLSFYKNKEKRTKKKTAKKKQKEINLRLRLCIYWGDVTWLNRSSARPTTLTSKPFTVMEEILLSGARSVSYTTRYSFLFPRNSKKYLILSNRSTNTVTHSTPILELFDSTPTSPKFGMILAPCTRAVTTKSPTL